MDRDEINDAIKRDEYKNKPEYWGFVTFVDNYIFTRLLNVYKQSNARTEIYYFNNLNT